LLIVYCIQVSWREWLFLNTQLFGGLFVYDAKSSKKKYRKIGKKKDKSNTKHFHPFGEAFAKE